jgi:hypothetical protein
MSMHAVAGLTQRMLPSGHLELICAATGRHIDCEPVATAMWIALTQHNGQLDRAADMLAGVWQANPGKVRDEMTAWAGTLCAIGVLTEDEEVHRLNRLRRHRTRPAPSRPGRR